MPSRTAAFAAAGAGACYAASQWAQAFTQPVQSITSSRQQQPRQLRGELQHQATAGSAAFGSSSSVVCGLGATAAVAAAVAAKSSTAKAAKKPASRVSRVARSAGAFPNMPESVKPGVVTGKALKDLYDYASKTGFAIPGVNVVGHSSINACMEAAAVAKGPIIVTLSRGGGLFITGKHVGNADEKAAVAGTVSAALHVRQVAALYGVPVILHTDHCEPGWLTWYDGVLEADEAYFKAHGEPLFSSHMLDLSILPLDENISICKKYMGRMAKIDQLLELEFGVTGGEEDGQDNTGIDSSRLYTQPEEVWAGYQALSEIPNAMFTIAAAFGNVHGVYKPGSVSLEPKILKNTQAFIKEKLGCDTDKPCRFVFHGGSGSSPDDIQYAIKEGGVIKMNIDTDTQWAFWDGMNQYQKKNVDYLQAQIGNPKDPEKPNKSYYDPRKSLRSGEEYMRDRLVQCMKDLNCVDVL